MWNVQIFFLCFKNTFIFSVGKAYSFTAIKCPIVSDYKKYGESHVLRCSLNSKDPILTPNGCQPISVYCGKCCGDVNQYCNVLII